MMLGMGLCLPSAAAPVLFMYAARSGRNCRSPVRRRQHETIIQY